MRLDHLLSKEQGRYEEYLQTSKVSREDLERCLILRVCKEEIPERTFTMVEKEIRRRHRRRYGGVAQLGEHLPCKQGVRSSILLISTMGS